MSESTKASDIHSRVQKMPKWLREWYSQTLAIISKEVPNDPDTNAVPEEIDEIIAFRLAVREYKRAERNKEVYGNALSLIMSATDAFEVEVGNDHKFKVVVHPADGQGVLSLTVEPTEK